MSAAVVTLAALALRSATVIVLSVSAVTARPVSGISRERSAESWKSAGLRPISAIASSIVSAVVHTWRC